jgi:endonuclease/exonuclease/phosphatase family metal-dependent hydrolase
MRRPWRAAAPGPAAPLPRDGTALAFALSTFIGLFLLQALHALLAVLFALVYNGIFPELHPLWLLLALVPAGALLAPALPFSLWFERASIVVWASVLTAAARVLLCLPMLPARLCGATIAVAGGTVFLGKMVGFAERRSVAGGLAAAFVLEHLLRLAGWSYDISMRTWWLPVQLVLAGAVALLALRWRRTGPEAAPDASLERRSGGPRLRGAIALGCILFLQSAVLARPEVAHRWLGVSYNAAAVTLVAGSALATTIILVWSGRTGANRSTAVLLALAMLAGVFSRSLPGARDGIALIVFALGHAAGLLLLDIVLQPAHGRRRGWRLAAGLVTLLALHAAWAFTFFHAFTVSAFRGRGDAILAACTVLLAAMTAFVPRSMEVTRRSAWRVPLLAAAACILLAFGLTLRPHTPVVAGTTAAGVRVATWNVHLGFDEAWRHDPGRIARTIRESGAAVVALQEVPAGLTVAYGIDVPLWLGRRLGMRDLFAPSINRLLGDAVLTALPVVSFQSAPLPPSDADPKHLTRVRLLAAADTLSLFATHFGITPQEQRVQLHAALPALAAPRRAVFLGDLNAGPQSDVATVLRRVGFVDAFEAAGATGSPSWPASEPARQIDWAWVRGYGVRDPVTSRGGGSDHLLVAATLRPR